MVSTNAWKASGSPSASGFSPSPYINGPAATGVDAGTGAHATTCTAVGVSTGVFSVGKRTTITTCMVTLNMPGPACEIVKLETLGGATISGRGMEILLSIVMLQCT